MKNLILTTGGIIFMVALMQMQIFCHECIHDREILNFAMEEVSSLLEEQETEDAAETEEKGKNIFFRNVKDRNAELKFAYRDKIEVTGIYHGLSETVVKNRKSGGQKNGNGRN